MTIQLTCGHCKKAFASPRRAKKYCSRVCSNRATGGGHAKKLASKPITTVWSCGGGIDSTAIAVLIAQGELEVPAMAFVCDCGWERSSTWDYVANVLRPRLKEVGCKLHVIRTSDTASAEIVLDGRVQIPAYKQGIDGVVRYNTRCSGPWKLAVAKRWLRSQGVQRAVNWIGIAANEARRAKPSKTKWLSYKWPLIERGMTREDCVFLIGEAGWPMPGRTSCVMCPQQSDHEWRRMAQREPMEFARACEIERSIQGQVPGVFLHRSCIPLAEWTGQAEWSGDVDALPRECNPYGRCAAV